LTVREPQIHPRDKRAQVMNMFNLAAFHRRNER
jgi:hypothetical protein